MELEKLLHLLPGLVSMVGITILLVLRVYDLLGRGIVCFRAIICASRKQQTANRSDPVAREYTVPSHI